MRKNNFIGIDIGCTNIKLMASLKSGHVSCNICSSSDITNVADLREVVFDFMNSFNDTFDGIGIAFSGITMDGYSVEKTTIPALENFKTSDLAIYHLDSNHIKLFNDSNAATIAGTIEYPKAKVLVGITNGTGIGLGLAINGSLFTGSSGALGEIYGSYTVTEENKLEKIGRIVSGSKIQSSPDSYSYFKYSLNYWNSLLSQIITFYNPDVVYFSGGGFNHHPEIMEYTYEFVKENCYPALTKNLTFAKSRYGNFAGCHGAIKLLEKELEE